MSLRAKTLKYNRDKLLTLSVSDTRQVLPGKELCRELGIKAGSMVDLVPPPRRGGEWYFDIRPRIGKPLTHTPHSRPKFFSSYHLSRDVLHDGIQVRKRVKLVVLEEVVSTPGLYRCQEV